MFDYYTVLSRAVSHLEPNNARAREDLYERARTVQNRYLETSTIKRSTEEIAKMRRALETAIQKAEANFLLNRPRAGLPAERAADQIAPQPPAEPQISATPNEAAPASKNAPAFLAGVPKQESSSDN